MVDFVLVSLLFIFAPQSPVRFVHCCLPRWINLDHTRTRTVFLSLCSYVPYVCKLFRVCFFYSKILQDENREKKPTPHQLVQMFFFLLFFFVSRWLDSMMWECFFPIISEQRIRMNSIMITRSIEHRWKRNLKCSFENFILIICLSIGKCSSSSIECRWWSWNSFREMLRRNYNSRRYWIDIELRHLSDYDDNLCDHLKKQPAELLPLVSEKLKNEELCEELFVGFSFSLKKQPRK